MLKWFDYTRVARRFSSQFPFLTYLLSHIVLWMIAYLFLAIIAHLVLLTAGTSPEAKISFGANLVLAVFLGFFYGIASGFAGWFFETRLFYNKSLGIVILGKPLISLVVFIILISIVRAVIFPFLAKQILNDVDPVTSQESWDAFFTCCSSIIFLSASS
jgi:adenylate cyclase